MRRLAFVALVGALVSIFPVELLHAQAWTWTWVRKTGTSGFNDSFCLNPQNDSIIYASPGNNTIVISRDRGHTWQYFSTVSGGSQIKAIAVSARDTATMLVAQEAGPPDRIMKTTNGGAIWFQTLSGYFYYWGHPLSYEPLHDDDVVYTQASQVLYRSTTFGTTWDAVAVNPFNSSNGGWEDAFISPDSANVLLVSDNANGIWKSQNAGTTWRQVYVAGGEVPAMAVARTSPSIVYATKWGGGGGAVKSTDHGESWTTISQFSGKNMWGVAISPTNPDYVVMNTWGHSFSTDGGAYISRNGGQTWERTFQGLGSTSNHSVFFPDTSSVFALQGDGIWKLRFPGIIRGWVSGDTNCNGVPDSGETSRPGQKVKLSGSRIDSTLTDSLGNYTFAPLGPGSYTVTVVVSEGSFLTYPPAGSYGVSVSDGEQHTGQTFGIGSVSVAVAAPNGGEVWQAGSQHDIVWNACGLNAVRIEYSTNDGDTWVTITDSIPAASGTYSWDIPNTPSTQCQVGVRDYFSGSPSDESDGLFTIGGNAAVLVPITAGWNLISNPVSRGPAGDSVKQLYPNSIFNYVYSFSQTGVYSQTATMPNGPGFWGKFPAPEANPITGGPRTSDSVAVVAGWNIIGSLSNPVDTSWVRTAPPGLVASQWFGYALGYVPISQLLPGGAYWVKSHGEGYFFLRDSASPSPDSLR